MSERMRQFHLSPCQNIKAILSYMGCRKATAEVLELVHDVIRETEGIFSDRICYREFDVWVDGDTVDLTFAKVQSRSLADFLHNDAAVLVFAATVGLEIDRLIAKYTRISPSRALALQAVGTERVERLCDTFCDHMRMEYDNEGLWIRPRFSPGYGDLSLELQKDIFKALDCPRRIGLTLNDSMLMSPTKSVTAIVGLREREII